MSDSLFDACASGDVAAVKYILENAKSLDINQHSNDFSGGSALGKICDITTYVTDQQRIVIVNLLLSHPNIDVNMMNFGGDTPLHIAAYSGDELATEILLNDPRVDVNIKNDDMRTPMEAAIQCNHAGVIKKLLATGKCISN